MTAAYYQDETEKYGKKAFEFLHNWVWHKLKKTWPDSCQTHHYSGISKKKKKQSVRC